MAADISTSLKDWSTTEASNAPAGSTAISTNLDDNLRQIQSTVRDVWSRTTVASASTCNIGAVDHGSITISGTTAITSFGTVSEGIRKWLTFSDALTLWHSGTSLILPTGANITTAAGDVACMESLGSGNWRCLAYQRASGRPLDTSVSLSDGTVSAPGLSFTSDTNTGIYRIGADNIGVTLGGTKVVDLASTTMTIGTSSHTDIFTQVASANGLIYSVVGASGGHYVTSGTSTTTTYAAFGADVCKLTPTKASNQGTQIQIAAGAGSSGSSTYIGGRVLMSSGSGGRAGGIKVWSPISSSSTVNQGYGLISLYAEGVSDDTGLQINPSGQIVSHFGAAPSISSGAGSGASIAGTNNGFKITCGTGAGTTIVVTLSTTVPVAPYAVANYRNGTTSCRVSATSTTQITITLASGPSNGDVIDVLVFYPHRETDLS